MQGSGIIVDFPTGRRLRRLSSKGTASIARLVKSLSCEGTSINGAASVVRPLPIRLDILTGIDDETVAGLAALAAGGIITAASAARLAMRHAVESSGGRTNPPTVSADSTRHPTVVMTFAGDVFGEFSLLLRMEEVWVGFASPSCLGSLYEICPPDRGSICLLIGRDAGSRNTIRVLAPRDWRRCLATQEEKRLQTAHHLLVLGGIPAAGAARSSTLIDLWNALRANGSSDIVGAGRIGNPADGCLHVPTKLGRQLLTLIELVMPGLVDVRGSSGEAAR